MPDNGLLDIFAPLNGASPWWWVAAALGLGIVEVLTFSFFLIWPALAALSVAILLWIDPGLSGAAQLAWFSVFAVAYTLAGRRYVMSRKPPSETPGLNNRAERLVGRQVAMPQEAAPGALVTIEIDGVRWRGRLDRDQAGLAVGQSAYVIGTDGMTLILSGTPPMRKPPA